jgi:subtilisin family serine protease
MRKSVLPRYFVATLMVSAALAPISSAQAATPPPKLAKLASVLRKHASLPGGWSRVIVRAGNASALAKVRPLIQQAGGRLGRTLPILKGQVAYVPNAALTALVESALVKDVLLDRPVESVAERTGATIGATGVREELGYDGTGIGVAVIDSGITPWHDDLSGVGGQRVVRFVDFVNGGTTAYDDNGHGTHVAGVVGGNGFDSGGGRTGVAPGANLTVLKVLDKQGKGHVSDVIAALDYVVANKDALKIRVVNLSVAAAVHESYDTDPLTVAARRAVMAGIVVVAAAGNFGSDVDGNAQYGSVAAPGNVPWVLTVGASSHMGTADRKDDTMAAFSSRGPTAVDQAAKPDVVAPGVGIESLSDPASAFYTTKSAYLLPGTVSTAYLPYLSLSGTSVAAPVVTGTVALLLQANPALTPNAVKAILQYTAQVYPGYDALTQGAGFINARGAVELARFLADPSAVPYPASSSKWGSRLIWANQRVTGGRLRADANAWATNVVWGADLTPGGQQVEWGTFCSDATCDDATGARWGTAAAADSANVVWGTLCGGADCQQEWTISGAGASVLDVMAQDTVVWGSDDGDADTVVWGSDDGDTVVWGSDDDDTVVWGSSCSNSSCDVVWNPNTR